MKINKLKPETKKQIRDLKMTLDRQENHREPLEIIEEVTTIALSIHGHRATSTSSFIDNLRSDLRQEFHAALSHFTDEFKQFVMESIAMNLTTQKGYLAPMKTAHNLYNQIIVNEKPDFVVDFVSSQDKLNFSIQTY